MSFLFRKLFGSWLQHGLYHLYSSCGSLSILNLWSRVSHHIWDISSRYVFKYFLSHQQGVRWGRLVKHTDSWALLQTYWINLQEWVLCASISSPCNFMYKKSLRMTARNFTGFEGKTVPYSLLGWSFLVLQCLAPCLVHRRYLMYTWTCV